MLKQFDRVLAPLTWLAAAFAVVVLFAGPSLIGAEKEDPAAGDGGGGGGGAAAVAGREVFTSTGCGGCHTLAAADSSGTSGPNLDETKPDAERVEGIVRQGSGGTMPSYEGRLSDAEIVAVARFVSGTEEAEEEPPPATTETQEPEQAPSDVPEVVATIRTGAGPDGIFASARR